MDLKTAKIIANRCHLGQTRRDGITPFITHVERVVKRCERYGVEAEIVATLHEILEDSPITLNDLERKGFSNNILEAVSCLTKDNHQSYSAYINGIKNNNLARLVKIQDILDNISDTPSTKQIRKYSEALLVLVDADTKM